MKHILAVLAFAICIAIAPQLYAAEQCYSSPEAEAEQLLRLHSELMVVTVTCRTDSEGENLVPAYTGFTKANIKALHAAEEVMRVHYQKLYGGSGMDQLDSLRTRLGNEYGKRIAELSAPIFCQMYRDQTLKLCHASPSEVHAQVVNMVEKPYEKQCPVVGN